MPRDPALHAIYAAQIERYEDKQDRKADAGKNVASAKSAAGDQDGIPESDAMSPPTPPMGVGANKCKLPISSFRNCSTCRPTQRMKEILKMSPEEQRIDRAWRQRPRRATR